MAKVVLQQSNNHHHHHDGANDHKNVVLLSCPSTGTVARASSVLQRNVKLYGPMNALRTITTNKNNNNNNNDDDTNSTACWNSDSCYNTNNNNAKQQQQQQQQPPQQQQQFLIIDFQRPVFIQEIKFQFQAGFTAEQCHVQFLLPTTTTTTATTTTTTVNNQQKQWVDYWQELELQDSLELQAFCLTTTTTTTSHDEDDNDDHDDGPQQQVVCTALKLTFQDFTDFYGRIILYRMEVWGKEEEEKEKD